MDNFNKSFEQQQCHVDTCIVFIALNLTNVIIVGHNIIEQKKKNKKKPSNKLAVWIVWVSDQDLKGGARGRENREGRKKKLEERSNGEYGKKIFGGDEEKRRFEPFG